nr:NAD-dependent epimerase/dehydratase family protein [Rhodocyclus purpureus]
MLGLAKRLKARIFQASTSEVYGVASVHPQTESYWGTVNPIGLRSCHYGGKRYAETLFFGYHRQHGSDIRVARIFNAHVPRMHSNGGRVVSNFIVQALHGNDFAICGEGLQTRSFCYENDLIEGFFRFVDIPRGADGAPSFPGTINLDNPGGFTIRQLNEEVIAMTSAPPAWCSGRYRPMTPCSASLTSAAPGSTCAAARPRRRWRKA